MRRFRRSHRKASSSRRRKVFWDGGQAVGAVNFGAGFGEEMQYLWWIRWPAGLKETVNETGIARSGELVSENLTLERLRLLVFLAPIVPVDTSIKLTVGATAIECNDPATFDNIVQTGGGAGGNNFNPDPTYDVNDDWIIREVTVIRNPSSIASSNSNFSSFTDTDQYQSRAKRKLPSGVGILGVISAFAQPDDTTFVLNLSMDWRALYKAGNYPL